MANRPYPDAEPMLQTHQFHASEPQGKLFAAAFLPRQLPVMKSGPEDESIVTAPRQLH